MHKQDAVLSQGGPRDAAVNFGRYRRLQRHRAVSLCQFDKRLYVCQQISFESDEN